MDDKENREEKETHRKKILKANKSKYRQSRKGRRRGKE